MSVNELRKRVHKLERKRGKVDGAAMAMDRVQRMLWSFSDDALPESESWRWRVAAIAAGMTQDDYKLL